MRLTHSIRALALSLAIFLTGVCLATPTEYEIKAAYLLNVLKLVERKAPPGDRVWLTLCLVSPGPTGGPLLALENSPVRGRKLRVRRIEGIAGIEDCEVVFFGRSTGSQSLVAKANTLGVLTVGNDSDFVGISGAIALLVENRRVVIEVNERASKHGDWTISSQLLEMARMARGG
jgi:hypothetical protein